MRLFLKLIGLILIIISIISSSACINRIKLGEWQIQASATNHPDLSWIKFEWSNDSFGDRFFEKAAMLVPVKVEGLPYHFWFQFDLGSNVTSLYGNPLDALISKHPNFDRMKNKFVFKNLKLIIGNTTANTSYCHVTRDYGDNLDINNLSNSSSIRLGTIGADIFQNKILVIDYPNQRFAIYDTLPQLQQTAFTDISLDSVGRVILPMFIHDTTFRVMFDNGASIFPLIISNSKIDLFSKERSTDTISVSSWGKTHSVIGRPLKEPFRLGNNEYSDIMIYVDYRKESISTDYDAITGNALFWDKVVIIDFKNQKFGIK